MIENFAVILNDEQKAAQQRAIQQREAEKKAEEDRKKAELDAVDKKFADGFKYFFIALGSALALAILLRIIYVQYMRYKNKNNSQENQVK